VKKASEKTAKGATTVERVPAANRSAAPNRVPPRMDKGEGEAAVLARIKALSEPSRSILARLHPLVMKHGKGLQPVVRWGFAVYKRGDAMVLVAAPRKNYVSFGYTRVAGIKEGPVVLTTVDQIDEAMIAAIVQRLED